MTITVLAGIILYFIIGVAWIRYCLKDEGSQLGTFRIACALAFKILMGCLYGYIFLAKYDGDDTWLLHEYSLEQQDLLLSDPVYFFTEMNPFEAFNRYPALQTNIYYYLSDLEAWLLAKPFAFFNILSGGNYYINIVFFSVITFWGHYWIFRLIRQRLTVAILPLYLCIFFVPPVVFWLSGLRADGLLFFFTALLLLQFDKLLRSFSARNLLLMILSLCAILILRSGVALLLVPALLSWLLVYKFRLGPVQCFLAVYGVIVLIFLVSPLLSPRKNLITIVSNRQRAFFALDGNTRFKLDTLYDNAGSVIALLPQAVNNTFLRPYPWEAKGVLQYATVLEVFLFLFLLLLFLIRPAAQRDQLFRDPLILTLICFSISLYILTGYTVPFPGAIVRYKAIAELFFFTVFCCGIKWKMGSPATN